MRGVFKWRIKQVFFGAGGWDFVAVVEPLLADWQTHLLKEELVALDHFVVFLGAVEFDFEERQFVVIAPVQFDDAGDQLIIDHVDYIGGIVLVEIEFNFAVDVAESIGTAASFFAGKRLAEEEQIAGAVGDGHEPLGRLGLASDAWCAAV